jgi:hypothetical protein
MKLIDDCDLQNAKVEIIQLLEQQAEEEPSARELLADDRTLIACAFAAIELYANDQIRAECWQAALSKAIEDAKNRLGKAEKV